MANDDLTQIDARLAKLEAERVTRVRLAQLEQELKDLGAKWKAARGDRKSLQGQNHPALTKLKNQIRQAYKAGLSERAIARASGVARATVHATLIEGVG